MVKWFKNVALQLDTAQLLKFKWIYLPDFS